MVEQESQVTVVQVSSTKEFVDDGREFPRALQRSIPPQPMYHLITASDWYDSGDNVSGTASFTSPPHEKYSLNSDEGFYIEDWIPEYIPDGYKLLSADTGCYKKTGICHIAFWYVPTTFELYQNVTHRDLETSKGFHIGVEYSPIPLDEVEDIIEHLKEIFTSQPGFYGEFRDVTRDGKIVNAFEGGNFYNPYAANLYFHPDEHTSVNIISNYHTLDELMPIFESIMK